MTDSIIAEESVSGKLYRYHPDNDSVDFTASWFVSHDGEIKSFICSKPTLRFAKDFGAWARNYKGPLKMKTAVIGVSKISKRFGFVELEKL